MPSAIATANTRPPLHNPPRTCRQNPQPTPTTHHILIMPNHHLINRPPATPTPSHFRPILTHLLPVDHHYVPGNTLLYQHNGLHVHATPHTPVILHNYIHTSLTLPSQEHNVDFSQTESLTVQTTNLQGWESTTAANISRRQTYTKTHMTLTMQSNFRTSFEMPGTPFTAKSSAIQDT